MARKARKARGDQVRQGPAKGILRSLAYPTSQRACFWEVGESLSPICLKDWGKGRLSHQRGKSGLAQRRAGWRIPIASSTCSQRQRRSEVRSVIEALILGGLERALNFDASCGKRQIPGCARLIAAQAAGLACREDPLELNGDKRGRSRRFFDSIFEGARRETPQWS